MALAAYDEQGRLKKHALLGTSLAVDPTRSTQRQQFEDLYGEAKTAASQGVGREGFLNTLSNRYGAYERSQQQSLAELARQGRGFEEEASKLRDREFEDKTRTEAQKFHDMTSGLRGPDGKVDVTKYGKIRKGARALTMEAEEKYRKMSSVEKGQMKQQQGLGQRGYIKDYVLGGEQRAMDKYAAYEANINKEVDRINASYIPLQEEYNDRQQRLADRVDLYNLFLGV